MQLKTTGRDDRYGQYELAKYEAWSAERNERDIKDVDSITINAVQQRANKYGFALAMSDSPTKYAQIQRAAHVLNEIINSIDQ
jgi:hypothetical protein